MYKNFFKNIDTEEKAYWLGFIAADGNIRNDMLELAIELQQSDREHLEKFAKCLDNYYKVTDYNREYPSSKISIYSKQCCTDLMQYGITPNKSLTLKINFDLIPTAFHRDVVRGIFDGDGSIYCSKPNRASGYNYDEWGINFVGTYDVLDFIKKFLNVHNKIYKKGNVFSLEINDALAAYKSITKFYSNASVFLERKYNKLQEFQSSQRLKNLVSIDDYDNKQRNIGILIGLIYGGGSIRGRYVVKQCNDCNKLKYAQDLFEQYSYNTLLVEQAENSYCLKVEVGVKQIKYLKHEIYPNKQKIITRHMLNLLDSCGLSIWFVFAGRLKDNFFILRTGFYNEEQNKKIKQYLNVVWKMDASTAMNDGHTQIKIPIQTLQSLCDRGFVPRDVLNY